MTKYIFVTGGVVSSIGKGIVAASLGRLLKNRGLKVPQEKFILKYFVKSVKGNILEQQYRLFHISRMRSKKKSCAQQK